jgi:uncharacterized delta-60 repeat protein
MAVAKYITNGTLDTAFGDNGFSTILFSPANSSALDMAIQSDGKIVVAGIASNGTAYNLALARLNTDGSIDTSFNSTGKVMTAVGGFNNDVPYGLAIQADGMILVAGYTNTGTYNQFFVLRYWY